MVRVSYQFLNDAFLDVERWLGNKLGMRIGRVQNRFYTTGTGSSQPQGLTAGAADSGVTYGAGASQYDELVDIQHSIDPDYRMQDGVCWSMHDDVLKGVRKIKDADGNPIWVPGIANGVSDQILGSDYIINNFMPNTSAGRGIVYGDHSKLVIRDVNANMGLIRLDERYAEFGQVAFLMWARSDSKVLDAGTGPLVYATLN